MGVTSRKCEIHGEHGILYICPEYSIELKQELEKLGNEFIELCKSGEMPIKHINKEGKIIFEGVLNDLKICI